MILVIGNFYYFLMIFLTFLIPTVLYFCLRGKSEKTIKVTLLIIAFANFTLHFLKIFHPSYFCDIEESLRRMSVENICALSTVVLPFAMLTKNKTIKSYVYLIAFLGGLLATFLPTEPNGRPFYEFNSIRFYFCHCVLFSVPLLALVLKDFKPDFKQAIWMPLMFMLGQTIILCNELFLDLVGLVDYSLETFLSQDFRNPSFVFGPNSEFNWIAEKFTFLIPEIFTKNVFGIEGVGDFYWPVVWIIIPVVIFFPTIYFLLTLPYTYSDVKEFCHSLTKNKNIDQIN